MVRVIGTRREQRRGQGGRPGQNEAGTDQGGYRLPPVKVLPAAGYMLVSEAAAETAD